MSITLIEPVATAITWTIIVVVMCAIIICTAIVFTAMWRRLV